jgi:hypothetical protein
MLPNVLFVIRGSPCCAFACRIGHFVPIWQPLIGSSCHACGSPGGAFAALLCGLFQRHPIDPSQPLVDLDLALVLTPLLLLGVTLGPPARLTLSMLYTFCAGAAAPLCFTLSMLYTFCAGAAAPLRFTLSMLYTFCAGAAAPPRFTLFMLYTFCAGAAAPPRFTLSMLCTLRPGAAASPSAWCALANCV